MKAVHLTWALSLCLCSFTLAAEDEPPKPTKSDSYYPDEKGKSWEYKTSGATLTIRVVGREKIGEHDCAKIETLISGRVVGNEHVAVKPDGVYRCAIGGKAIEPPVLFLRLPPKDGAEWEVKSKLLGQTIEGKMQQTEQDVTVNNKFYKKAIVVKTDGTIQAGEQKVAFAYYFAKGVGMIKQEVTVGKTTSTLEVIPPKSN